MEILRFMMYVDHKIHPLMSSIIEVGGRDINDLFFAIGIVSLSCSRSFSKRMLTSIDWSMIRVISIVCFGCLTQLLYV